jgi:cell division protein FtsI (penicillin-binding protein 3)
VSQGKAGYKSGVVQYWLSFAGYFPSDNPRYSCIVCIKKSGLPASGGGMSGVVFHHIAEGVMARNLKFDVKDAHDETSVLTPDVKNGDSKSANYVLKKLDIKKRATETKQSAKGKTPDVTGMGARDAVYLLENRGLRVRLVGRGKVKRQSYPAGKDIVKGAECVLTLE